GCRALPRSDDVVAEVPGVGRAFRAADDTGRFIVVPVVRVSVDGCGARLKPDLRRLVRTSDCFPNNTRRAHPRLFDQPAIPVVVAAVDASPGEIDRHIGSLEFRRPFFQSLGVPFHNAPRCRLRISTQNNHLIPALMKRSREDCPDLTRPAWDY